MNNCKRNFAVFAGLVCLSPLVFAQVPSTPKDQTYGFVGLGFLSIPEYEGASDNETVPLLIGKLSYNDYYLETHALGLRAKIASFDSFEVGPSLNYRFGRDNAVENRTLRLFNEIDDAIEIGAFAKISLDQFFNGDVNVVIDVLTDVADVHNGAIVSVSISNNYMISERFFVEASVNASYANDSFMERYFSVNQANSVASGLEQYDAEAGVKDVSFSIVSNYRINDKWGVSAVINYQELLGNAADSPIVEQVGDSGQLIFGAGVAYSF